MCGRLFCLNRLILLLFAVYIQHALTSCCVYSVSALLFTFCFHAWLVLFLIVTNILLLRNCVFEFNYDVQSCNQWLDLWFSLTINRIVVM